MNCQKFEKETTTLIKFYECYCHNKHKNQKTISKKLTYKGTYLFHEITLCEQCEKNINYCFSRLIKCPHHEKPRCRKCNTPCYEKEYWKYTAKVMRYSGVKLHCKNLLYRLIT